MHPPEKEPTPAAGTASRWPAGWWQGERLPQWRRRVALAVLLIGGWQLMRWLDARTLAEIRWQSASPGEAYLRLALFWATAGWVLLVLLARSWWLRWPAVLLAALSIITDRFYLSHINGDGFTPDEIFLALTNPSTVGDSLAVYWRLLAPIAAVGLGVAVVAGGWLPRLAGGRSVRVIAAAGLVVLGSLGLLMAREGYGYAGHAAAPLRLPAFMLYYAFKQYIPPRNQPTLPPPREKPLVDHLVFIIDESVMGSHLGVNGYPRNTTPRLAELVATGNAVSLGVCSSATNYSVGSFLALLSGVRPERMRADFDHCLTDPSVIAYAAAAGYQVQFLNSQDFLPWIAYEMDAMGPALQTVSADRNGLPAWQWDQSLREAAVNFAAAHDRTLTIIAKRGAHYPYHDKCPPDRRRFQPCLDRPEWSDVYIENANSYDNAIAWTCDDYLAGLLEALDAAGRGAVILYTSDHGQILPGEPIPGFTFARTHAMPDSPTTAVVDVPLLLLATAPCRDLLARLPAGNRSLASHWDVFPTLLRLMGYPRETLTPAYGPDLWLPIDPARQRLFCEGKRVNRWQTYTPPDNSRKFEAVRAADQTP